MSRYGNNLIHWKTREVLNTSKCYTGEESGASYEMFPDNTLIHCQLISDSGKNIKVDNSFGNQLVWCRVSDQRCFYSDILYSVKIIKNGVTSDIWFSTRASLVNWPRPNKIPKGFLEICDKDDNTSPPELGHENDNLFNEEKFAAGNGVNAVRKLSSYVYDGESDKNPEENSEEIQNDLKKSFEENGMSNSDASFLTSGVKHMDKHNLKMAKVMADEGMDEAVKQMFVHPAEGRQMSYGEMRSFYG